jgi:hypothetical protein
MTDSTQDRIAAIERALDGIRYARGDATCPEHAAYNLLKSYAADLRAQTPTEINRVLLGMTDQINRAKTHRAKFGYYDAGHAQTLAEGLCGRWWKVINHALIEYGRAMT